MITLTSPPVAVNHFSFATSRSPVRYGAVTVQDGSPVAPVWCPTIGVLPWVVLVGQGVELAVGRLLREPVGGGRVEGGRRMATHDP